MLTSPFVVAVLGGFIARLGQRRAVTVRRVYVIAERLRNSISRDGS